MKRHAEKITEGTAHISAADPVMRRLARVCPPLTGLRLQSNRFAALTDSILSQQISVHAARAIRSRLLQLVTVEGLTPTAIQKLTPTQLRAIGVSRTKVSYLKDLAERVASGQLRLSQIGRMSDDRIIEQLTQVAGIGVWTAQMFLIFSLGRLDVFPSQDHGVRTALRRLYALERLPDHPTSQRLAQPWRPYATIATWYCWRSHQLEQRTGGGI